jgi:predicted metal-dependent hydrolase
VQLKLPWLVAPVVRPARRHVIQVGERETPVTIVRHRLARRYVVRVGPDGEVRLTVPRWASIARGLAFASRQALWIEREWRRASDRAAPWEPGTRVWFRGRQMPIDLRQGRVYLGEESIGRVDGKAPLREGIERALRALATVELIPRARAFAADHGLELSGVTVRNQRSRWGACSPSRTISLNWRLIQMPPSVCDYVIFHELMHLRQPNHSRRFWREVEKVCDWWREAERWLRKHGRELH